MSYQLLRYIDVTVKFNRRMAECGLAEYLDDDIRPREFLIQIHPDQTREDIIKTIGHELAHVKQFAKGELSLDIHTGVWHKKEYTLDKMSYYLYPWEVEAFGFGETLYRLYVTEFGDDNE